MTIKVAIVDDHMIVRQGLKSLLEKEKDIEVIADASDGRQAILMAQESCPDVIIMDMQMREMSGLEATRQIMAQNPAIRIIILSMALDRACVVDALKSGAKGYVIKECASEELVTAIHTTMKGFPFLCNDVTKLFMKEYVSGGASPGFFQSPLSGRELDVLRLIAEGKNAKEIAFHFGLSVRTIEGQRNKIMKKLNLFSVAELARYAAREGLVDSQPD